ncbi:low density lipoprotein receptor adapter protein 1-B-like isoform X2 [Portunus trituberculatus]|uniref:low density lipoprotein receptor adapter protein 1-B-like isoform X2 n=1 Tax=Portunus trituberculatus TaxID=210409 RepID=UPI001E1CFB20|nr:low density lipoprotein receptor adapter protein 1-B-like isoform X2 [Portunus trituberculatus]
MSSLLRALFTGTSKHKKLSEEWATLREPVVEGVTFYCKYLGSTLVDDPKGEAATAEAIKRIIHTAKQVARKPERVALHVSLKGIRMEDGMTKELLLQTSIYKISYCSADAHYDHVFAFIATNDNETCECHAFLCPKRKMAQAVTISIAQAFNLAYECWKMSLENKESEETYGHEELPAEVTVGSATIHSGARPSQSQPSSQASSPIPIRSDFGSSDMSTSGYQSSNQALLIDLEDSSEHPSTTTQPHTKTPTLPKPLISFKARKSTPAPDWDEPSGTGRSRSCSIHGSPSSFSDREWLLAVN